MSIEKKLQVPVSNSESLKDLHTGEEVLISGKILVGRDQVHEKLTEIFKSGKSVPTDFKGAFLYYMGPSPAPPGKIIGAAGPTTSSRMDPFTPYILEKTGIKGIIGKGPRSSETLKAFLKNSALYFHAFGGCGALYGSTVSKSEIIMFPELGPEALRIITVHNFPVIVAYDFEGNYLYPDFS